MSTKFSPLKRDYEAERKALECERVPVSFHPLLHSSEEEALNLASVNVGVVDSSQLEDAKASDEDDDPLSNSTIPAAQLLVGEILIHLVRWEQRTGATRHTASADDGDDSDGPNKSNSKLNSIWVKRRQKY